MEQWDGPFVIVYIDGGKTIQGFLDCDLIDEIILTNVAILIGIGIPLFGVFSKDKELMYIETKSFETSILYRCQYGHLLD